MKQNENNSILERLSKLTESGISMLPGINESLTSLQKDESAIIDNCTSPELQNLMLLNRSKHNHLIKLLKQIVDLINSVNKFMWEKRVTCFDKYKTGAWKLGNPYFKTKDFFGCPLNSDVKRKKCNNELVRLKPAVKWSDEDQSKLKISVGVNYLSFRKDEVRKRIQYLKANMKRKDAKDTVPNIAVEIENLETQLTQLNSCDENDYPPLNWEGDIDWMKISYELKGVYQKKIRTNFLLNSGCFFRKADLYKLVALLFV